MLKSGLLIWSSIYAFFKNYDNFQIDLLNDCKSIDGKSEN